MKRSCVVMIVALLLVSETSFAECKYSVARNCHVVTEVL